MDSSDKRGSMNISPMNSPNNNEGENSNNKSLNSTSNNIKHSCDVKKSIRNSTEISSKYKFFEVETDELEVEKHMSYILSRVAEVEKNENKKYLMEKYSDLEVELLKTVKNSTENFSINQKKFLKIFIYENLHAKFLEKNCDERRKIESKICDVCIDWLKKIDEIKDFKNHFNINFSYSNLHIEKNDNKEITQILEAMENSFFSEMKFSVCSKLNICSVPNFFIKNFKKNLKQKIRKFWKLNYEIPIINLLLESKFGFKFLQVKFRDLIDERLNIFDSRYFSKELRDILFKFFIVINLDSMKKNKNNLQAFFNNFKKYVYLMGLHDDYDTLINLVVELTSFESPDYVGKNKLIIDSICERFILVFFPNIRYNKQNNNLMFGLPTGLKEQNIRNEDLLNLNLDYLGFNTSSNNSSKAIKNISKSQSQIITQPQVRDNGNYLNEEKFKNELMNIYLPIKEKHTIVNKNIDFNHQTFRNINNNSNLDSLSNNIQDNKNCNINNNTINNNNKTSEYNKDINNEYVDINTYDFSHENNFNKADEIQNEDKNNIFANNNNTSSSTLNSNQPKNSSFNILDFFAGESDLKDMSNNNISIKITDETRLLTVFSFSIMLNNLMTTCLVEDSQPVDDGEVTNIKILFTPNLKCSARERNFLINFLFALEFYGNINFKLAKNKISNNSEIDELNKKNSFNLLDFNEDINSENDNINKPNKKADRAAEDLVKESNFVEGTKFSYLEINYMMENSILAELVKSYSKVLYNESNKQKLVLDNEKTFDIFYNFNENDGIINDYETFLKTSIENISESSGVKKITSKLKNLYSNISSKFRKHSSILQVSEKKIKLDLSFIKFIPLDPISISPHLCLCVSGGFIQDSYKENFWLNFGLDDKVMDYYFLNWQEDYYRPGFLDTFLDTFNLKSFEAKLQEYKHAFKKNKRLAKGYGKLLAYLLASRYLLFKLYLLFFD